MAQLEIVAAAEELRRGSNARLVVGEVLTQTNNVDQRLVRLVVDAYRWFDDLRTGRVSTVAEIARREGRQVSDISRILPLAFMAPDLVSSVINGLPTPNSMPMRLKMRQNQLPLEWVTQREQLLDVRAS